MVSIIIPNYNHARFLQARIESVLAQSFQNFELIILDDCSTDNSLEIIERYRDHPKVTHIKYSYQNSGSTFSQWNYGLGMSRGDLIWIAESDDLAEPSFLSRLVSGLDQYPNCVMAYCGSKVIDADGAFIKNEDWSVGITARNWNDDFIANGLGEIANQMFFKCSVPNTSAVVFRKSLVDSQIFKKISTMRFAGDWLFWVHLMEKGDVFYIGERLNSFRMHTGTTRYPKSRDFEIKRFNEYFSVIKYVKIKYRLAWNLRKHYWLLAEWAEKYVQSPNSGLPLFNRNFPLIYNLRLIIKVLKNWACLCCKKYL